MTALAAAGGTAVVQAAGTDTWTTVRARLALWFGQGDEGREREARERLDQTGAALTGAESNGAAGAEAERLRSRREGVWRARIEDLLETLTDAHERHARATRLLDVLPEAQRDAHAERLRALVPNVSAPGGNAVDGDMTIRSTGPPPWRPV
ncbi:hypothetical protein [Streptomyces johnsoniae]|uniref:Uncharacterized protein n=1 Tax=Streptomyces johnsoniae TaxID=3075532 RepID=A0ABU2S8M4_9ACTN|nr:hypothetical protein [Streptomyces sp. DSM 41886]MDT0445322.1 hypothetical protein [Streptomyces sp. DSM 41886]